MRTLAHYPLTSLALACSLAFLSLPRDIDALGKSERPAQLESSSLRDFDALPPERRRLLQFALETGHKHGWLKYRFGSADPENGGFDCSGSMYYVLRSLGHEPPRTSAQQYRWLLDTGRFTPVPPNASSISGDSFSNLEPGDLLFWSGTYKPVDNRKDPITHVQMYLGVEKDSGTHLMIGASNGRTYKGRKQNGYGVFEFRLPSAKSKSRFVGYGTLF